MSWGCTSPRTLVTYQLHGSHLIRSRALAALFAHYDNHIFVRPALHLTLATLIDNANRSAKHFPPSNFPWVMRMTPRRKFLYKKPCGSLIKIRKKIHSFCHEVFRVSHGPCVVVFHAIVEANLTGGEVGGGEAGFFITLVGLGHRRPPPCVWA